MGDSRELLERAMGDCLEHLGVEINYAGEGLAPISITALKFSSDVEYDFGDGRMVGETAKFEILIDDVAQPQAGDIINFDGVAYQIFGEPLRNLERRTWDVDAMVMT
tara:strand:+ start:1145 stop:1465 length:321 start_codon:yes stop_codon:yes gene_type:complete